jgi:hypothetical protein
MSPNFVGVDFSNTGDFIIRVEILSANIDKFLSASSIERINMYIGRTYNIKLTQGRIVKNTKYVRFQDNTFGYN